MTAWIKYIYIIGFVTILSSIGLLTMFDMGTTKLPVFQILEQRNPAAKPSWKWDKKSIQTFFPEYDAYINDSFALRETLIHFYTILNFKLGVSIKPDRAILGKNNFIFLGNIWKNIVNQTTGKDIFTKKELKEWMDSMKMRREYLDKLDIKLFVVMAPNKHSVYPEYLPNYIHPSSKTRASQILNYPPDFNFIDLRPPLLNAKSTYKDLLYNKTDSHWSGLGAYVGYKALMKNIQADFPELDILNLHLDDFIIADHSAGWGNAHMLNLAWQIDDFRIEFNKKGYPWFNELEKTDFSGAPLVARPLQKIPHVEQSIIYNRNKPYVVLVLKDSFSEKLSPYLNQTFGKIIYCHYNQPEGKEFIELVEKFEPDFVIYEFVERSLKDDHKIVDIINFKLNKAFFDDFASMDGSYLYYNTKQLYSISGQKEINNNFSFYSNGDDPVFILPELDLPTDRLIAFKIDITLPNNTDVSIFYQTKETNEHSQKQFVRKYLQKGRNLVKIILPEKGINGARIRIDPGSIKGTYLIHSIKVLVSK